MATFSTRINLTERSAAAARPTTARSKKGAPCARLYLDTRQRGFGLSVSAGGAKSFLVMRRVNGKQERHVFGKLGELTVAEARARAEKLLPQMTDGVSLNDQRRRARAEAKRVEVRGVTLRAALDLYEGTLRAKGRAPRTIEDYRYFVEKYLAGWLDRPLADIGRPDARKRHAEIAGEIARGKYTAKRLRGARYGKLTANHAMRAFRAIYNRAVREHPELPTNPTINVDWNQENRRTGRIAAADMKSWHDRVRALGNSVRRDYLLFALFTGLRKENAAEPRWSHVDWERRVLRVPEPKSQKPFDLPLSDFLVELLKARAEENKKLAPNSPWVFPAARGDGHIVEVRMKGGDTRYTPHDLRRTFISVAESLGVSREARQLLVNHSTPRSDVHGGYVVPELDELRAHMEKIAARLLALCRPPEKTTVVPLRKRAGKR
jgi:integrase